MAAHPAHNRSVRCAVSQSGRATYEISRRSSPTAITSATSITAKFPSLHSNVMRLHHDNPPTLQNIHLRLVRELNQHPSARYFPQAATSQPRAPYRGHGGLAQQARLGYVASVATRANNAKVCFWRILLQKSAAVDLGRCAVSPLGASALTHWP